MENNRIESILEQAIECKFPNIENLMINTEKEGSLLITFNEGKYSKQEVEEFIEYIKSDKSIEDSLDVLKNLEHFKESEFNLIPIRKPYNIADIDGKEV